MPFQQLYFLGSLRQTSERKKPAGPKLLSLPRLLVKGTRPHFGNEIVNGVQLIQNKRENTCYQRITGPKNNLKE